MRILITGFDPFGGEPVNPAWEAVKRINLSGNIEIFRLMVPTVYGRAIETVTAEAERIHPDAIVCIGQAGGRKAITPERVAINMRDARIPDNAGNQPKDVPVVPGGPAAYFATLPVRKITEALNAAGICSEISYTAGTFVCNDLMYGILNYISGRSGIIGGFIHVPCIPDQLARMPEGTPAMELDTIVKGLETALTVISEYIGNV